MEIKLLDCTLRDGGYINNWEFGNITIKSIISRLDNAGLDFIECGFLDSREVFDENRTIFPYIDSIGDILGKSVPQRAKLVAMIDFGTFDENRLVPQNRSVLYGIRLIFQKEKSIEALEYAKKIKDKGYKLFLNLVATFTYSPFELLGLVEHINALGPEAVSIVDTYGIMFDEEMTQYAFLLDSSLNENIALGFHSHNNTNFSDANCVSFINKNFRRKLIIDSSILGMGKNSGNAHTEVLALYLDKKRKKPLECSQILECAVTDVQRFLTKQEWGYNIDNLVSAICECSPNWVKYYSAKGTLTISNIMEILEGLPRKERRLVSYFSKELADTKYMEFCEKQKVGDEVSYRDLKKAIGSKDVFVICPGHSLKEYMEDVVKVASRDYIYTVTVNFYPNGIDVDCVFIGSNRRYSQVSVSVGDINGCKVISTSNVLGNASLNINDVFSYSELYGKTRTDNSAILLMEILSEIGVKKILLAGFDGYGGGQNNYFLKEVSLGNAYADNEKIMAGLENFKKSNSVLIEWVTPSIFEEVFKNAK